MTKPRSLADHAAHLKHYRDHFTVIFGQSVLPGQPTLLSSGSSVPDGRSAYPPAAPAGTGRAGPEPVAASGQPSPVYQVRARLKSSQTAETQATGLQATGFRGPGLQQTGFQPMFQPGAEPLRAPQGAQPDQAAGVGIRPAMGSAPSELVGDGFAVGSDGTDVRQTEGVDPGKAFSGVSLGEVAGPAAEATLPEISVLEQRRWQSPPLPSPEDQERISVPEARVQSAQLLSNQPLSNQAPISRSAAAEPPEDAGLARNTSTGQLGFRDLLGFTNSAAPPAPTSAEPETSAGSMRRQPMIDRRDRNAATPSALLAAAGRGSAEQAGASNTAAPTISDVQVDAFAPQVARVAAESVYPDFVSPDFVSPAPAFPDPAFSASGTTAELADFNPERTAPNPVASSPAVTQLTTRQQSAAEQEPAEPRSARMDSGSEGGPAGLPGQVPDPQDQRSTEADSGPSASAGAGRVPGPLKESQALAVDALPSAGLTPISEATREPPGAEPRNGISSPQLPSPEPLSPELSGPEAFRPEADRPEQPDIGPISTAEETFLRSGTGSGPGGPSSGPQTSSTLLQAALSQTTAEPDDAESESGTAVSPVLGVGTESTAAAQSISGRTTASEDTAGAERPVQTASSDPAPNTPGAANPASSNPASSNSAPSTPVPGNPAAVTSAPANLESASPDLAEPAAPVKFLPPGEDLETLRRLRESLPATDPGVGFSLPRRPRPVPIKAPKVAEVVPEAPVHTQEQALSFLDRLQRLAEREADGSSDLRALSVAELLTWDKAPPGISPPPAGRTSATPGEAPDAGLGVSAGIPLSPENTVVSENRTAPANAGPVEPAVNPQATVSPRPATAAADRGAATEASGLAETAAPGQTTPPSRQTLSAAGTVPQAETVPVRKPPFPAVQASSRASPAPPPISQPPLPREPASPTAPVFPATASAGRPVLKARLNPAVQPDPPPPASQDGTAVNSERSLAADAGNVPVTTSPGGIPAGPGRPELLASQPALQEESGPENETPSVLSEVGPDRAEALQTAAKGATAETLVPGTDDARPTSGGAASDGPTEAAPSPSVSRAPGQEAPILGDRSAQPPVGPDERPENLLAALLSRAPETGPEATEQASVQQTTRSGSSGQVDASAFQEAAPSRESLTPFLALADSETRDLAAQNPDTLQGRPASVLDAALAMTPTPNLLPAVSGLPDQPILGQADTMNADSESFAAALPSSGLPSRDQPSRDQSSSDLPSLNQSRADQLRSPGSALAQPEAGQGVPEQAGAVPASRLSRPSSEVAPTAAPAPVFTEASTSDASASDASAAAPGRDLSQGREPVTKREDPKGVGDAEAVAADQRTQRSLTSETLPSSNLLGGDMTGNTVAENMMPPGTGPEMLMRKASLSAAPEPVQMPQGPARLPTAQPLLPRQPLDGQTGLQAAPRPAEADLPDAATSDDRSVNFRPFSVDSEPGSAVQSGQPLGVPGAVAPSPVEQLAGVQPSSSQASGAQALDTQPPGMQRTPAGMKPALPLPVQLPSALPLSTQSPAIQSPATQSISTQSLSPQPLPQPLTRQEQTLQTALADPAAREPLPLSVRARLAPLLGRGLGETQLLRNAAAATATTAAAADALAVGDTVLLSPGQDLSSPRGLGLLAHELTHVLRQRDPGFVPAVVRGARAGGAGSNTAQTRSDLTGGIASATPDEEGLAEHVEGLVREQFERQGRQQAAGTGFKAPAASAPSAEEQPWGSLPAPWEAMPFWDAPEMPPTPSAGPPRPTVSARARSGAGSSGSGSPASQGASASSGAVPVAQAASTTRSVPSSGSSGEEAKPALPAVGSDKNKARNTPDLDRLAQQVYSLIKGRLHTEIRRDR